jgi:general secretion pathway protein E/type IV pilus assembly protein PilB
MAANDDYLVDILRDVGLVTRDQIEEARAEANGEGVIEVLVKRGVVKQMDVTKALANQFGMETINLADLKIADDVLKAVPRHIARKYKIVPVYKHDSTLVVAISDPLTEVETLDTLRFILKCNVEGVVAMKEDLVSAVQRYYGGAEDALNTMLQEITEGEIEINPAASKKVETEKSPEEDTDAPIIKLVSLLIMEAYRNRASDIHIEPLEKRLRVRYRIDGVMHEVENPPKRLQSAIISRLKIMSNMSIAEKRIPQDGRIQINVMGKNLDLRVSSVPTTHGESIVMRILDKTSLTLGLPQLGFFSDDQATMERIASMPDGLFLVTGPTGSGKSTTLYSLLNFLNRPDKKIITCEDPVEYMLAGINQVHVNAEVGLTFAAALRSMLRQAPNIIMVGEIRDMETGEIAVEASQTGHMVFSTLHTNDAPSAVTRLLDMGIKPFMVASAVRAILAQRLVRRICQKCKEPYTPTESELRALKLDPAKLAGANLYHGKGCNDCSKTGFRGRMGIHEILVLDDELRRLVYEKISSTQLRARARALGMRTLREDGVRKVLAGLTTPPEVIEASMEDEEIVK